MASEVEVAPIRAAEKYGFEFAHARLRENAVKYLRVVWQHSFPDEPVLLLSELDDKRREVRKIEIFRDGRRGWAGLGAEVGGTRLGTAPVPPLDDIARDPQFDPVAIDAAEFEVEWRRCPR